MVVYGVRMHGIFQITNGSNSKLGRGGGGGGGGGGRGVVVGGGAGFCHANESPFITGHSRANWRTFCVLIGERFVHDLIARQKKTVDKVVCRLPCG